MSQFDELFDASCAPVMIEHFGDVRSVSIQLGDKWLVRDATAMIRSQQTIDEYTEDRITKRLEMEIDLRIDKLGLPDKGLDVITTAARVDVNGVRWNIDSVRNRTKTFITLKLFRKFVREQSTSGFRREDN